jgi:predicted membrane chloride channel (bestrophin family)
MSSRNIFVAKLRIDLSSMSLVSTFVALLLTLRSNQSLSRLKEARNALGEVVLHTREMAQLIGTSVYTKDKQLGLLAGKFFLLVARTQLLSAYFLTASFMYNVLCLHSKACGNILLVFKSPPTRNIK